MLLGDHRLLSCVHTTDRGAVAVATGEVPRAHALNEGDLGGDIAVGRPLHAAAEGAGSTEDSFELQTCHNVGISTVAIRALYGSIEFVCSRSEDYGANTQMGLRLLIGVGDGVRQTEVLAETTAKALFPVNDVEEGDRLGIIDVDSRALTQTVVEAVDGVGWAVLGAEAASRTLLRVHVSRPVADRDPEVAGLPRDPDNLTVGQDLNIPVSPTVHELGGEDAHCAVIRGKRLVKPRHNPPDGGRRVNHVDLKARFS